MHSRCEVLFVAVKTHLSSVRPSRNESAWFRIIELFIMSVFFCVGLWPLPKVLIRSNRQLFWRAAALKIGPIF